MRSHLLSLVAFSLTASAMTVLPPATAGDLYKWTDEKGRVHYTSTPPPETAKKAATIDSSKLSSINALPNDPHKTRAEGSEPADSSGPSSWTPTETASNDNSTPASPPVLIPPSLLPPSNPPAAKTAKLSSDPISMNFNDIEMSAVLKILADFVGLNILLSDSVKGTVTIHLQDKPWDQALDIILQHKGLAWIRQSDNTIFVASPEEIAAKNLQTTGNLVTQPATSDIVEVVAQGMGIDANSALLNAYSNAVQQALGLYVDAETMVQNDQIVQDKILTYSKGFIQEATTVKQSQANGLFQVNIRAKVKRQQLLEQAKANNITVKAVEGVSLHAQVESQIKQESDAKALLEKALLPLIGATFISADFIPKSQPTINNKDTNEQFVILDYKIQIFVDKSKYFIYVKNQLIPILNQIASSKGEFTNKYKNTSDSLRYEPGDKVLEEKETSQVRTSDENSSILFSILVWQDKGLSTGKWLWFNVPKNLLPKWLSSSDDNYDEISNILCKKNIELNLLNDKGEIIALGAENLVNDRDCLGASIIWWWRGGTSNQIARIAPFFTNNPDNYIHYNISPIKFLTISVKIPREDISLIKSANLEVKSAGDK